MTDIVSSARRSEMMAGIRGRNTKPEMLVRSGLHRMGFRFRLHYKRLPGKPDLVLPKYRAIILVNGCFWHMHGCHLFKLPKTRPNFWRNKLERNKKRDDSLLETYRKLGWRILVVWECSLRGSRKKDPLEVLNTIAEWLTLKNKSSVLHISGKPHAGEE